MKRIRQLGPVGDCLGHRWQVNDGAVLCRGSGLSHEGHRVWLTPVEAASFPADEGETDWLGRKVDGCGQLKTGWDHWGHRSRA